jgi:hypothetical protein
MFQSRQGRVLIDGDDITMVSPQIGMFDDLSETPGSLPRTNEPRLHEQA